MRLHLLACLGLLLTLLAGCASDPARIKPSPLPAVAADAPSVERLWAVSPGGASGEDFPRLRPAVLENRVFAATDSGRVIAVDEKGSVNWEQRLGLALSGGLSAGYGRIFLGTAEGELLALSAMDGKLIWRQRLSSAMLAPVALAADRVVAQSQDGRVQVLDAGTGSPVWSYDVPVPQLSLRGYAMPIIANGKVVVASAAGKVVALDLATGAGLWESQVATPAGRTEVERLVDIDGDMLLTFNETLYVGSYQGQLVALDLRDRPESAWEFPVSTLLAPAEGLGNVYVINTQEEVLAVDDGSGKAVWKQDKLKGRLLSAPAVVSGWLVLGDAEGYVHFLSQSDGRYRGRLRVKGAVVSLQVQGDSLLVTTRSGQVSRWKIAAAG